MHQELPLAVLTRPGVFLVVENQAIQVTGERRRCNLSEPQPTAATALKHKTRSWHYGILEHASMAVLTRPGVFLVAENQAIQVAGERRR